MLRCLREASWKTLERKEEDKRVNLLPPFLMNGWPGKSLNSFPIVVNVYLKIKRGRAAELQNQRGWTIYVVTFVTHLPFAEVPITQ